jgi:hypothetical protein
MIFTISIVSFFPLPNLSYAIPTPEQPLQNQKLKFYTVTTTFEPNHQFFG